MSKKAIKSLGRLIAVMAVILTAMILSGSIRVHADNGETVRVSTSKELKAAIKNADVGTIILRTNAYLDITIKADKAAKTKTLIIDAKNAVITNKAVFADISIYSAKQYTESASGNYITLSDAYIPDGLFVAKKKTLKNLSVFESYGNFSNNYTLRKGAKLSNLELVYSGEYYPIKSSYDKSKKQLTLSCESDGCEYNYTIKLDKKGRIKSIDCKSNYLETTYYEEYTYDSNGNVVKYEGKENMSGKYTSEVTYSKDKRIKSVYKSEYSDGLYTFTYDKKGRLIHDEYFGSDSMDGVTFEFASTYDYEYDKKGRLTYERWEIPDYDNFQEISYTYNSKGFLTEMLINTGGSETVYKYKYNEAGDLIEMTCYNEGDSETFIYEYDELGYPV